MKAHIAEMQAKHKRSSPGRDTLTLPWKHASHKHTEVSVIFVLQGETSGHDTGTNILCKMHCQMHFRLD